VWLGCSQGGEVHESADRGGGAGAGAERERVGRPGGRGEAGRGVHMRARRRGGGSDDEGRLHRTSVVGLGDGGASERGQGAQRARGAERGQRAQTVRGQGDERAESERGPANTRRHPRIWH
jgi:hypothetical protein